MGWVPPIRSLRTRPLLVVLVIVALRLPLVPLRLEQRAANELIADGGLMIAVEKHSHPAMGRDAVETKTFAKV